MYLRDAGKRSAALDSVLLDSFRLLRSKPALFIPKTVSTLLGSVWFIGFLEQTQSYTFFLLLMPLLVLLGLFTSVLLASAVRENSLRRGFYSTFRPREMLDLVLASTGLVILLFLVSLPLSGGIYFYSQTGSLFWMAAGAATTLVLTVFLTYRVYFLPVALTENAVVEALKTSSRTSSRNRRDVLALTALSFVLLGVAFGLRGALEVLGYLGFVAGRLLSSVVNTYLFVVSPKYYEASS